ncbi:MAG: hypothetical protein A3C43_00590 [Candidatus Schekmanbacteria bacterium RIFCSPHIGHO2_02_FULL_38_11]|uniref:Periplasmic heavy metal sensor n=1 Tax=Candidatus Schekmanbacteria bacterium RIFCSPLOWO2_12_FULL_38_15 TaxID=1817883 RepID=A0A1F7SQ28_9BACT|nr:MAG: hypothetical protein A2043_03750 [Candidatus Schekmanbacteria bacterium GWA2_38_9]OGL48412.1 MAG: hypothetical protein A3H37_05425 [Candidatus Schekmanbacteria bacterium RIFCSPLOWO2_02_FULL_38_14]OGL52006.1 MAG: hypothetical protein A3C43_00590 [Candidatus Schekmanbacteria bacterium RIFCSPHIGHO2_02_FULL_38_11]OGL55294.1 MAG: hypothetical protein A3G31_04625 [Candidatus Schekmanbacteria bacterium RIFCSPLOWO2_12_FULL_38_15]
MRRKIVFLLFLISSIVIFSVPVKAMMCGDMMGWFGGKGHKHGGETPKEVSPQYQQPGGNVEGGFYLDLREELNLSEFQIKALDEIGKEYENERAKKALSTDKLERELAMLQMQKGADMEEIKKKVDEMENLRKEIRWDYIKSVERAKKLLTDEQLDRLSKISKGDALKTEQEIDRGSMSRDNNTMGRDGMGSHGGMMGGH